MSEDRGERGFRELVENAPDVIARFDEDLRYVYVNPAVRAATGCGPEEYVGKTNRELAGNPDEVPGMAAVREGWDEALRRVFETGQAAAFEIEVPAPGGPRWYESRMVPEFEEDGSVGTVVAVSRDVTEHKRARERLEGLGRELREQGETLGALLDGLAEGVLAFDEAGRTVFANPAAREMLGLGCGDLPDGTPDPFGDFDLPREVARCVEGKGCAEVMAATGDGVRLRVRLRHLDEFDGRRGGILAVMEDLAEGRPLEAAQQRFLAIAAHELKTPLTAIVGAAELLMGDAGDDPETRRRFLGHVSGEARRMRRLAEVLLGLARTGHDVREPELETVDLLGAVREAASRMEPVARAAGVELRVKGERDRACCADPGCAACAHADPEWLGQALLAVLDNAVKYSGQGKTVLLRATGSSIAVEDEGIGISEAELPRVFEAFYRSESSRQNAEGSGLGLHVCQTLVERMGGGVSVGSREGSGTTVKIELPEAEVRDAGRPPPVRASG